MQEIKILLPKELKTEIELIKNDLRDLKQIYQPKAPNQYLTRQDVAKMLQIDLSSLWGWTKKGILTSYQISGRVYYKLDEVEEAIVKLKK